MVELRTCANFRQNDFESMVLSKTRATNVQKAPPKIYEHFSLARPATMSEGKGDILSTFSKK